MSRYTLSKSSKLCSVTAIELLFKHTDSESIIAYPLRGVWRHHPTTTRPGTAAPPPVKFMITIPKKKLRHAVDRVTMRRRVREAYRLCRAEYETLIAPAANIDLAFIYLSDKLQPYHTIERAVRRIMSRVAQSATHEPHN